ncbi:MAG: DALR domain-containing protein, partial [Chloroflexota bacterium]|nr:DALR domain-containing protein [Chloroflexota bacterium]
LQDNFEKGMDDDFNTAVSIGCIYQTIRAFNKYLSCREFAKTDEVCAILSEGRAIICRIGEVLGLFQVLPADYLKMMKNRKLAQLKITVSEIEQMVKERNQARKDKDWARADEIRDSLLNKGIILEDGKGTTDWKVK